MDEDQRAVALDEVTKILGLSDRTIAVIAGTWKAKALHFEQKYISLATKIVKLGAVWKLKDYLEYQKELQGLDEALCKLRETEDVLTEKILAREEQKKEEASHRGKTAANALHDKPNGTREKREAIQAIWASGKYDSRDICADEEWAALKMSRSTARKALIGQPDPT